MKDVKDEYPSDDAWTSFLTEVKRARGAFQTLRQMQCEEANVQLLDSARNAMVQLCDADLIASLTAELKARAAQHVKDAWIAFNLDKEVVSTVSPVSTKAPTSGDLQILHRAAELNPHLCLCSVAVETEMLTAVPLDRIAFATVKYYLLSMAHHDLWDLQIKVLSDLALDPNAEFRMYDAGLGPISRACTLHTKADHCKDGAHELVVFLFRVK